MVTSPNNKQASEQAHTQPNKQPILSFSYYQLAHNERHPVTRKLVAKIIHRFGRADELEQEQLVRLCNSIARVCSLQVFDPLKEGPLSEPAVWPQDLKLVGTRELGTVLAVKALWKRLGIGKTLRDISKEPESKLGVWDRWLAKVHLPGCESLKLHQMFEAMDFLYEHAEEIEKTVFFSSADLFNLSVD